MSAPDPNDPSTWGLSPEMLAMLNRDLAALDSPAVHERVQGIEGVVKNGRDDAIPKLIELLADDAPVIGQDDAGEVRQLALAGLQRLHWRAGKPLDIGPVLVRPTWPLAEMRAAYERAVAGLSVTQRQAVHDRTDDYLARRVRPSPQTAADARAYRVLQELGLVTYERQPVDPVTLLTPLQEAMYARQVENPPPPPRVKVALRERPDVTIGWIHRDARTGNWTGTFSEHPARDRVESLLLEALPSIGGVIRRVRHDDQGRPVRDEKGNLVLDGEIRLDSGEVLAILRSYAAFLEKSFAVDVQAASAAGKVPTLNDLSEREIEEARAVLRDAGRPRAVRHLCGLVERCDTDWASDFVEDVLKGGADARTWRQRDRVAFPAAPARELVTRPLAESLSALESIKGTRWVRVKPRMSAWTASPAGGAPGVLVRATPYWWKGPAEVAAATVGQEQVEEISDLEVAGRRWIASQVASELRGKPLPATPPGIAAALGVRQPLSRDGEIAITALMLESAMEPDDRPPGFRGPDAWFRSTGRPEELTVTADEAVARGLPPVDIRLDASASGLIHSPLSRRGSFYLRLHGAPADAYEFALWPAAADERGASSIERSMRRVYEIRRPEELRFGGHLQPVELAGDQRPAVCVYAALPPPMPGIVTCVVLIEHARGLLMAAFTHDVARDQELTPAQVLEHPRLRGIARSLQVS